MASTWLDIVDTAVKIGLGAAISGIATYAVTRYKHVSDKSLEATQRKRDALSQVAEEVEEFSHISLNYWARILDWTRKRANGKSPNETQEQELRLVRTELFNSYKVLASAESKLLLMGEQEAQDLVRKYGEELTKFYSKAFVGDHGMSIDEIQGWREVILSGRIKVFNELSRVFKSLET
ncbi:hypothetical protein LG325_13760 [Marinobacter nauticus]